MINNLHTLYRNDPYLKDICNACNFSLEALMEYIEVVASQLDINTATWSLEFYEREVDIPINYSRTEEERRASVKAKWRSSGKADLALIQSVADSWKKGSVIAEFRDGVLILTFNGDYGVPDDLLGISSAL